MMQCYIFMFFWLHAFSSPSYGNSILLWEHVNYDFSMVLAYILSSICAALKKVKKKK